MTDRRTASTITETELDQLYDQLAALRTVARGYCPTCGRGDAAPTVEDWERERQRADRLATEVTALRDDLHGITGARWIADMLDTILNGDRPTPGPAAAKPPACRYCPDPLCPENCPECGGPIHDLDAVPSAAGPAATQTTEARDITDPSWSARCRPPGCGAQPGEPCRRHDGTPASVSHGNRWREYDRQRDATREKTQQAKPNEQEQPA